MKSLFGRLAAGEWGFLVSILVCQAVLALAVWPQGEFALNDDWVYSLPVKHLLEGRGLVFTGYQWAAGVSNVLWGALFAAAFGFSQLVLRLSVVALSAAGSVALYLLARRLGMRRSVSLLAALALMCSPWSIVLTHSFMTDVPYVSSVVIAVCLGVVGTQRRSAPALVASSVVSTAALYARQMGVLVPLGMLIPVWWGSPPGEPRSRRLLLAVALCGLPIISLALMPAFHHIARNYGAVAPAARLNADVAGWAFKSIIYLGVFALPVIFALTSSRISFARGSAECAGTPLPLRAVLLTAAILGLGSVSAYVIRGSLMPYLDNIVTTHGSFGENEIVAGSRAIVLSTGIRVGLTAISVLAGATFLVCVLSGLWRSVSRQRCRGSVGPRLAELLGTPAAGLVGVAFLQWTATLAMHSHFDRYLLPIAPFAILALAGSLDMAKPRTGRVVAWGGIGLVLVAAWGVTISRDQFVLHRAVWRAASSLVAHGVSPQHVEAGYEWDGWHAEDRFRTERTRSAASEYPEAGVLPWYVRTFRDLEPMYVVALSPVRGYTVIGKVECRSEISPAGPRMFKG